ncbi:nucleotidyltransferase domain-containing protein [Wenzhouxiangella limi]
MIPLFFGHNTVQTLARHVQAARQVRLSKPLFSTSVFGTLPAMRLRPNSQKIIRDTVAEVFGADAEVLLFGSRLDDKARGGDIDLLIKLNRPESQKLRKELTLVARLQLRLGDQPIDVLVIEPGESLSPIKSIALQQGARL